MGLGSLFKKYGHEAIQTVKQLVQPSGPGKRQEALRREQELHNMMKSVEVEMISHENLVCHGIPENEKPYVGYVDHRGPAEWPAENEFVFPPEELSNAPKPTELLRKPPPRTSNPAPTGSAYPQSPPWELVEDNRYWSGCVYKHDFKLSSRVLDESMMQAIASPPEFTPRFDGFAYHPATEIPGLVRMDPGIPHVAWFEGDRKRCITLACFHTLSSLAPSPDFSQIFDCSTQLAMCAWGKDLAKIKEDGNAMEADGDAMKVDGEAMDVDGEAMDVDGEAMDVDGEAMDVDGEAMDVDEELEVQALVDGSENQKKPAEDIKVDALVNQPRKQRKCTVTIEEVEDEDAPGKKTGRSQVEEEEVNAPADESRKQAKRKVTVEEMEDEDTPGKKTRQSQDKPVEEEEVDAPADESRKQAKRKVTVEEMEDVDAPGEKIERLCYLGGLKTNDRSPKGNPKDTKDGSYSLASTNQQGEGIGFPVPAVQANTQQAAEQIATILCLLSRLFNLIMPLSISRLEWELFQFACHENNVFTFGGLNANGTSCQFNCSSLMAGLKSIGVQGSWHPDIHDDNTAFTLFILFFNAGPDADPGAFAFARWGIYLKEAGIWVVFAIFKGGDVHSGLPICESPEARRKWAESLDAAWNILGPENRMGFVIYSNAPATQRTTDIIVTPGTHFGNGGSPTNSNRRKAANFAQDGRIVLGGIDAHANRLGWEFVKNLHNSLLYADLHLNLDLNDILKNISYTNANNEQVPLKPLPLHPVHDRQYIIKMHRHHRAYRWDCDTMEVYVRRSTVKTNTKETRDWNEQLQMLQAFRRRNLMNSIAKQAGIPDDQDVTAVVPPADNDPIKQYTIYRSDGGSVKVPKTCFSPELNLVIRNGFGKIPVSAPPPPPAPAPPPLPSPPLTSTSSSATPDSGSDSEDDIPLDELFKGKRQREEDLPPPDSDGEPEVEPPPVKKRKVRGKPLDDPIAEAERQAGRFSVNSILNHRWVDEVLQYQVQWEHHPQLEYQPAECLDDCKATVVNYQLKCGMRASHSLDQLPKDLPIDNEIWNQADMLKVEDRLTRFMDASLIQKDLDDFLDCRPIDFEQLAKHRTSIDDNITRYTLLATQVATYDQMARLVPETSLGHGILVLGKAKTLMEASSNNKWEGFQRDLSDRLGNWNEAKMYLTLYDWYTHYSHQTAEILVEQYFKEGYPALLEDITSLGQLTNHVVWHVYKTWEAACDKLATQKAKKPDPNTSNNDATLPTSNSDAPPETSTKVTRHTKKKPDVETPNNFTALVSNSDSAATTSTRVTRRTKKKPDVDTPNNSTALVPNSDSAATASTRVTRTKKQLVANTSTSAAITSTKVTRRAKKKTSISKKKKVQATSPTTSEKASRRTRKQDTKASNNDSPPEFSTSSSRRAKTVTGIDPTTDFGPQPSDVHTISADLYGFCGAEKSSSIKLKDAKLTVPRTEQERNLEAFKKHCITVLEHIWHIGILYPYWRSHLHNPSNAGNMSAGKIKDIVVARGSIINAIAQACGTTAVFSSGLAKAILSSPVTLFTDRVNRDNRFASNLANQDYPALLQLINWLSDHNSPEHTEAALKLGRAIQDTADRIVYQVVSQPDGSVTYARKSSKRRLPLATRLQAITADSIAPSNVSMLPIALIIREAILRSRDQAGHDVLRRVLLGNHAGSSSRSTHNCDQTNPIRKSMVMASLLLQHIPPRKLTTRIGISNLLSFMGTGQGVRTENWLGLLFEHSEGGFFKKSLEGMVQMFSGALENNLLLFRVKVTADPDQLVAVKTSLTDPCPDDSDVIATRIIHIPQFHDSRIYGQPSNYLGAQPSGRAGILYTPYEKFSPYFTSEVQDRWMTFLGDMQDQDPATFTGTKPTWEQARQLLDDLKIVGFCSGLTALQFCNNLFYHGVVTAPSPRDIALWIFQNPTLGAMRGLEYLGFNFEEGKQAGVIAAFEAVYAHIDTNITDPDIRDIIGFNPIFVEHLLCKVARWTHRLTYEYKNPVNWMEFKSIKHSKLSKLPLANIDLGRDALTAAISKVNSEMISKGADSG